MPVGIVFMSRGRKGTARALIGFFDLAAWKHVDKNVLSYTIPYKMFLEMDEWKELKAR